MENLFLLSIKLKENKTKEFFGIDLKEAEEERKSLLSALHINH